MNRPAFAVKSTRDQQGFQSRIFYRFFVHHQNTKTKVALYERNSTTNKGQDADNQLAVLREFCQRMAYQVYSEYVDEVSGGTSDRPMFKKLFEDASRGKFHLVLFWSLDRWSREGTRATIRHLEQLELYGVGFKSFTEQYIDSCGIFKDVILALLSNLAKQEKIRISKRVKAGLVRSRKKGGRPKLNPKLVEQVTELKAQGYSNRKIAETFKISHSTVCAVVLFSVNIKSDN